MDQILTSLWSNLSLPIHVGITSVVEFPAPPDFERNLFKVFGRVVELWTLKPLKEVAEGTVMASNPQTLMPSPRYLALVLADHD